MANTITIGTSTLTEIPFAPGFFVDVRGHRVFNRTRLGTFQVFNERYFINEEGSLTLAMADMGMLHEDDSTRYFEDPGFNCETEQYGFDLNVGRAVSWDEIIQSIGA